MCVDLFMAFLFYSIIYVSVFYDHTAVLILGKGVVLGIQVRVDLQF